MVRLLRSSAAYGGRVGGVLLTRMLHMGTAGLTSMGRCGGTPVVQTLAGAALSEQVCNALMEVEVIAACGCDRSVTQPSGRRAEWRSRKICNWRWRSGGRHSTGTRRWSTSVGLQRHQQETVSSLVGCAHLCWSGSRPAGRSLVSRASSRFEPPLPLPRARRGGPTIAALITSFPSQIRRPTASLPRVPGS